MTDVRLITKASLAGVSMDWLLQPSGLLDESHELATAVLLALGTDSLADKKEILPDPDSTDRRGWWGDLEAEEIWDGWPIGCKNWLLLRSKITDTLSAEGNTVERARQYTQDALQPFITKGIASAIQVTSARVGLEQINVNVTIYRPPLEEIELRFAYLWDEIR